MRPRDLVVDLERGRPVEVESGALELVRRPRDLVDYFRGLSPEGRATDPDAVAVELAATLGHAEARPETRLTRLLDPREPRAAWRRARAALGVDRWPPLAERPLLGPLQLAAVAAIPPAIGLIAFAITGVMVVAVLSALLVAGWVGAFVLYRAKERRVEVVPPDLTLAALAARIAARRRELAALPPELFDPARIEARLRGILRERGDAVRATDLDHPFDD